ncbi:MAG: cysteine--tRNA ligase [Patescibacteria group bacterium]
MLQLYNTLSRKKEPFEPLNPDEVTVYTCGPTVYHYAHIGNMRTFIFEDTLKRVLKLNGYKVKHVMNITDVGHLTSDADEGEDKMEKGARREGRTAWEVAEFYTKAVKENFADLNIEQPTVWAKATDHIQEQIAWIKKLEAKGFTYTTSDGVYYDTSKFTGYGILSRQKLEDLREGARVRKNEEKKNPTDFALWKFSPKGAKRDMEWDSPWGMGFPGWHLECSVMAQQYLGDTLDIHCGGIDLIPVHHTNEIAQAEAVTGKQFVRYWLHGEFVVINPYVGTVVMCAHCGEKHTVQDEDLKKEGGFEKKCGTCGKKITAEIKMSKSDENFTTLLTVKEKGFNPLAFRFLTYSAQYRTKLNFSWKALQSAQRTLDSLYALAGELGEPTDVSADFKKRFTEAANDDLNMPKAVAVAWELLKSGLPNGAKKATLLEFDSVLALNLKDAKPIEVPHTIKELAERREDARAQKNFSAADELRDKIAAAGFAVEDTPGGPVIKQLRT